MPLPPVVALEIGTTKTVALVGEMREDGNVMITGMGETPSAGIRKSEIVDLGNAILTLRSALERAEETGRVDIREVNLVVSGGHIRGTVSRGNVPVLDEEGEITEDDVDQVMDVARAIDLAPDQEILHTICQNFYIDNTSRVLRPEGMVGSQLALDMLIIYGFRNRLNNTIRVIDSIPLDVMDVAFGGLCSALAVLTAEQKRSGALVIDLGGGTTDFLAYADTVVAAGGALGIGGDHVTNDIAQAFNIPISQAERIKRESGSVAPETAHSTDWVNLPPEGGFPGCKVKLKSLYDVIHSRMEETLDMARKQMEKAGVRHQIGAGIILTGGGAHMDGICGLAEKTFGIPCRVGRPRHVSGLAVPTERPEYAACSGLVQYAFKSASTSASRSPLSWLKNIFQK